MAEDGNNENEADGVHSLTSDQSREGRWFTPDELRKLSAEFSEMFGNRACEMCGNDTWTVGTAPVTPVVFEMDRADKRFVPAPQYTYPSVSLTCRKCGNTKMFQIKFLAFDPFEAKTE